MERRHNMTDRKLTEDLLSFIEKSPSCFHAVSNMRAALDGAGFTPLQESEAWKLRAGGQYYVTRNGSSLIAFRIPEAPFRSYQIIASHSDSPSFKVKEHAEMDVEGHFTRLNVEKYGGMLCAPWFDRPLSIAGRAVVKTEGGVATRLVNLDRDLLLIPNLAIHMTREANDGYKYDPQKDMLPLLGDGSGKGVLGRLVAQAAGCAEKDVLSSDLFLYNRMKGTIWGANEEFMSSPKLDDLQCAFSSLTGFLQAKPGSEAVTVHCVFDNEEVGSNTKQGAASPFLQDVLRRINAALGRSSEQYHMAMAGSFMLSADNAHSVHPNHADKSDPTNRPFLHGGIVVKYNANQKYTTDAVSAAVFLSLCERAGVPTQTFANRSDMPGGSTLGNIANTQTAMNTVDIGLAQLAMHSPYETAGVKDTACLVRAAQAFFSGTITCQGDGTYQLLFS